MLLSFATSFAQGSDPAVRRIRMLTDRLCEGRATGSRGGLLAGMWIAGEFDRIGLNMADSSYFRSFTTASGEKGRNIIGILPGSGDRYILVGAHYDHLGTLGSTLYPGADSNASGVAALLSLAERLSGEGRKYAHGVIFVAFDAKQHGMGGSREMVRLLRNGALTDPSSGKPVYLRNIDLMVNIDQVGGTSEPLSSGRKDYLIMLSDEYSSRRQALIAANGGKDGPALDISFSYYGSKDFTNVFYRKVADQRSFLEAGVPAVMFTSGITRYNNKPSDTPEVIDFAVLGRRIELMYRYLKRAL